MAKVHVLIVEDEEEIAQLVSYNLIKAGFNVTCAESGEDGLECVQSEEIDCILLDLMLPGMSGMEVCNTIKTNEKFSVIPIIMLTAKGEEDDIIAGFECGVDDYVPKPFSPKVLIARIKAVLRRKKEAALISKGEAGDMIKTPSNGFTVIVFLDDKSQIRLQENCTLEINGVKQNMVEAKLIGDDPVKKKPIYLKEGRFGTYIQLGDSEKGKKLKTASLLRGMDPKSLTLDIALELLTLPKMLGTAENGENIVVSNGKFGPYIKSGKETRTLPSDTSPLTITLDEARELLKESNLKTGSNKTLGKDSDGNIILIKEGKFGPYVTNGQLNASIPKTATIDSVALEDAITMLQKKAQKDK